MLVRCDTAGATHGFADACRDRRGRVLLRLPRRHPRPGRRGHPQPRPMAGIRRSTPTAASATAPGSPRPPPWSTCRWPAGTRLILRKERPHPGAQLRFTDADGMRVTAFITDTAPVSCPAKSPVWSCGTVSTPASRTASANSKPPACATCRATRFWANAAWLEIVLAATDLVTWTRLIGFADHPGLARAEITTFRYRVLHVAARITRGARQLRLRIDATWRWAALIATAWQHIRTAFG